METRANYIVIGSFMMAVLLGAFLFVYWLAATADSRENVYVKIIFPAPVTGLPLGGQVLFNGIKVGDVSALDFDPKNPKVVVATVRVKPNTPLRADTKAALNFQGLTGVAYVDLNGGSLNAPLLLREGAEQPPVMFAQRSAYDDIVEGARNVLKKADSTLATIDGFLQDNRPVVTKSLANVEKFSDALAANSEGVKNFMAGISSASDAFVNLSGRMEKLVQEGERILAAVPSDDVTTISKGLSDFAGKLGTASAGLDQIVADTQGAAKDLRMFSSGLNQSLADVDKVIKSVDPEKVTKIVGNVETFSTDLNTTLGSVDKVVASINPDKLRETLDGAASVVSNIQAREGEINDIIASTKATMQNFEAFSATVRGEDDRIIGLVDDLRVAANTFTDTLSNADGILKAVDPQKVSSIVDSVANVTGGLADNKDSIDTMIISARKAAENVESVTAGWKERKPDMDQIITDAKEMTANLNATSTRIQSIVDKVGTMVEGDGEGFIVEATKAAAAIRKVAEAFQNRADSIAVGLSKFANQGSADFSAAMSQVNRTLVSIQRAVDNFDRNPNRVIFGGENVPTFTGGRQRR